MQNVLTGMRLIEGSAFIAAPSGGMALALLGADVIRFDAIGGGLDYGRWPVTADGQSLYWLSLNKGKRSIAIDFRRPEGRELLTRLIAAPGENAGLFLSNFPPRGWLADEALREHREDLIYLSLSGDRHGRSALDYTVNCKVGLPFLNRFADGDEPGRPLNNPLPAWDIIAGQHIALGLLAAERHRRMTGAGQFVRLALADVALATMGHLGYIAEHTVNGGKRPAVGNHVYGAFGHDFACRDRRRLMVVAVTLAQWRALVAATGTEADTAALAERLSLDFELEGDRYRGRDELVELLTPWFASRSFDEVRDALDRHGVCWGEYQTIGALVERDPECSTDNPLFDAVEQPGVGRWLMPGNPLEFGAAIRDSVRPAPKLGQHTDEILAEELGLSAPEIGQLHDRGIVAGA